MATSNVFSGSISADSAVVSGAVSAGSAAVAGLLTATSIRIGGKVVGGQVGATIADSTAIAQAAGFVPFDTGVTLASGLLIQGSTLRIRAVVRITTALNGGATSQSRLLIGGANFGTSAMSTGGAVGTRCVIDACFTTRADPAAAVGTSGCAEIVWSDTPAVTTVFPAAGVAVPTLATNGVLNIGVAGQSSGAGDGSGRIVLEQLTVSVN